MIAALRWGPPQALDARRVLRPVGFAARSSLPLSAACVVANGAREQLSRLLALDLDVELIEPTLPGPDARHALLDGALIYRTRGKVCDAFVVVRPADARRLVALAFKEPERSEDAALSEIERTTLERIAGGLVPLCTSLCGTLGATVVQSPERAAGDVVTYFEVRTIGPARVAVGFGLTRDPVEQIGAPLLLEDLSDVELEFAVEFASGEIGVAAFSRLAVGTTLPLGTALGAHGTLRLGGIAFARGACGVRGNRTAFVVEGEAVQGAA